LKSGDFILAFLVVALTVFGIIMVFSASYYYAISEYGDAYYYLKREIFWAVGGTIAMLFFSFFSYRKFAVLAPIIFVVSILLLLLIFTPLGHEANGAVRWLSVGPITIMPGELAKIAAIIFVSWYFTRFPKFSTSLLKGVLPMLVLCGIYGGLIILQPNLSTAITVCIIIIGILFIAGMKWWHLGALFAVGGAAIGGLILSGSGEGEGNYWLTRFTSFLDPFQDPLGSGWQVIQSLLALGSGGLFGLGLGKSVQKTLYLPEPQNDFILAIIGEELGFIGCLILIIVYVVLIWRCCHIALNAPDRFGMLLASGITIMLAVQVILNIAVVTSSMPPTGIALPFVSYGGNSLLIFMASMGIMLNISRHSAR